MRKLTIVFFEAGGGHRNAAEALKNQLESQQYPWIVSLLNIQELLDSLDIVRSATGVRIQDVYNMLLRKGWTRLSPKLLVLLQGTLRIYHSSTVKALEKYWHENPTNLVLSVIPHFNRAFAQSVQSTLPGVPFVTLLTDLADYPPHFWIERESQYIICGTERARQQALSVGHRREQVFQTSGMILKPTFYRKPTLDRCSEKKKLVLDPDMRTGLVLFGGHGSHVMLDIAELLDKSSNQVQLIMLSGRNQKLASELRALQTKRPMFVEEFTSRVDHYMALADFFIGKPGPGCISEALQFDLPLIVECNARTLPQERYNTQWLTENKLGIVLKSFADIADGVRRLLDAPSFAEFQTNARHFSNGALFEVPVILDEVFERSMPRSQAGVAGLPGSTSNHESIEQGAVWASA